MKERLLILEDSSVYEGVAFGGDRYQMGESIFQTGMSGYQEIISGLPYHGQIVMMTCPATENCGISRDDFESISPKMFGFVVKEYCETPNNFRGDMTLGAFMKLKGIPGIVDIDMRETTRKIRDHGICKAIMTDADADVEATVKQLRESKLPKDGVQAVSTVKPFPIPPRGQKVVMVDIGTEFAVIREFNMCSYDLIVVPYNMSAQDIPAIHLDGIVYSGGPGVPEDIPETVATCKELLGSVSVLGIGLGHEVIAATCGANVVKMKVGHHGNSSPVRNLKRQKIEFTAQNHGYEVESNSIKGTGLITTYTALNDSSIEGFIHKTYSSCSCSFESETAPGVDDCTYILDDLCNVMKERNVERNAEKKRYKENHGDWLRSDRHRTGGGV